MRRKNWKKIAVGGAAAAYALATLPVFAQTGVSPPTREEIERGVVEGTLGPGTRPVTIEGGLERAPCPLASPEFADIRFTPTTVSFRGLETVDAASLAGTYGDFLGQEQPISVVCEIRDRAATALRQQGYLAAVQVPPQRIEAGEIVFDVLMARMTQAQVRGDAGPSEKLLQRYIEKLQGQPVFNVKEAERYLLLARDIPGLDIRLALRPTEGRPGEVIGEFSVARTPVFVDATVQNLGTKAVGRFGALGRVRLNGLTGLGDQTTISAFSTLDFDEQQVLQFGHAFRVGSEGLTISGNFTYAWTQPSIGPNIDINSETLIAGVQATYPFKRSQASNLFGSLGFEYIDQQVDFGSVPLTKDKISVLYARLGFNALSAASISGRDGYSLGEPNWAASGSIELRHGLDIFGASEGCGPGLVNCAMPGFVPPSRIEGDPTAFVLRAQGQFDYRPDPLWTLSFAPRLQYSPDALFSYEEFSGGNYTIGRGFDPGILIGDSGIGFRSEVRYGSIKSGPSRKIAVQPYVFFDAAWVWNEDAAFNGLDPQDLYSVGGGLRAEIARQATLDATLAVPLNRAGFQADRGDVRFLFSLTVQLAPWRQR